VSLSHMLNKRVLIQASTGQDELGQPGTDWANVVPDGDGKVWAGITDISARDYVIAGGEKSIVTTKIQIRYRTGIAGGMRVLYGADIYQVEGVLGQDGRTLILMCSRGAAQ
jgi:SPP1 family predicted phage head-tail adaptor